MPIEERKPAPFRIFLNDQPSLFEARPHALMTPAEIYDSCNEKLLRILSEDNRFEKKSASIHAKELAEIFNMWANTPPHGGIIVVGISTDNIFEGCNDLSPNQLNDIEKAGITYCPDAEYISKRVEIHRDKDGQENFVVVFLVRYHPTRVVKLTDGRVFARIGDSKRRLKDVDIRHLQDSKGEISFESEPCKLQYPRDFDIRAIDEFVETVRSKKEWNTSHKTEHILELMHLGSSKSGRFVPNLACALLFARDPRSIIPGCRIRFFRFQGEERRYGESWNAVKDIFIDGTIPMQIQATAEVIKSQLRSFSMLGKDGKFYTSSEYPEFSWYEAVVNACAHRSYGNGMKNMNIFVTMYDDRLEVQSPGPFPPFVTPRNIYDHHSPRNPYLMEAMYYLRFVRCAAEGTKRIRAEMLDMKLPAPEFREDSDQYTSVQVVLRNNIKQRRVWVDADVVELLGTQIAHSLTENEKLCINFVAEYREISVSQAQRLTHLTWPMARKMLGGLVDRGILEHTHKPDKVRDPGARFKLRSLSRV